MSPALWLAGRQSEALPASIRRHAHVAGLETAADDAGGVRGLTGSSP
jgi:hypothetical protein